MPIALGCGVKVVKVCSASVYTVCVGIVRCHRGCNADWSYWLLWCSRSRVRAVRFRRSHSLPPLVTGHRGEATVYGLSSSSAHLLSFTGDGCSCP